jgi:serine/threonine protein kinase
MKYIVVYLDPEAKPSSELVDVLRDHDIETRWIRHYTEIDPQVDVNQKHAIIIDLSSADPDDYVARIQEVRSIDLTLPALAAVPPFSDKLMGQLVKQGVIHKFIEQPFSEDDLAKQVIDLIEQAGVASEPFGSGFQPPSKGTMEADEVFGGMIAELEGRDPEVVQAAPPPAPVAPLPLAVANAVPPASLPASVEPPRPAPYQSMRMDTSRPDLGDYQEQYFNYFLEERIATGGMAEIFKARQRGAEGFEKIVAIKRILPMYADDEEFVAMFIDEARLAATMAHPNIVKILDFGKWQGTHFLTLEYVDGKDLRWIIRRMKERGLYVPEPIAAHIASKVASALHYIHSKESADGVSMELVHRDISPQNIMISKLGTIGIVDFGVAKAASKLNQTMAGALKGKIVYMSPEQASGAEHMDGRSDIFSLGLVLHEMLTTKRCYSSKTEMQSIERARNGEVPPVRIQCPFATDGIEAIITHAAQKGLADRYPTARDMEKALRDHAREVKAVVDDGDVAEFLAAVMDKNPDVLAALLAARYPEVLRHHEMLADGTKAATEPGPQAALPKPAEPEAAVEPAPAAVAVTPVKRSKWLWRIAAALLAVPILLVASLKVASFTAGHGASARNVSWAGRLQVASVLEDKGDTLVVFRAMPAAPKVSLYQNGSLRNLEAVPVPGKPALVIHYRLAASERLHVVAGDQDCWIQRSARP